MSKDKGARLRDSSSDHLPYKPTRESADASEELADLTGQRAEPAGEQTPDEIRDTRHGIGTREGSEEHPPHVTQNDEEARVQDSLPAENDVPVLPANATGADSVPVDEQDEPIDRESMYDNRPDRSKNNPPSRRAR